MSNFLASCRALSSTAAQGKGRVLILGGSGFLGSEVAKRAVASQFSVTSLSRRGKPSTDAIDGVEYVVGDATDQKTVEDLITANSYDAIVHTIGLLFDADSGLAQYNRFVSGSGSLIREGATYDDSKNSILINLIYMYGFECRF